MNQYIQSVDKARLAGQSDNKTFQRLIIEVDGNPDKAAIIEHVRRYIVSTGAGHKPYSGMKKSPKP